MRSVCEYEHYVQVIRGVQQAIVFGVYIRRRMCIGNINYIAVSGLIALKHAFNLRRSRYYQFNYTIVVGFSLRRRFVSETAFGYALLTILFNTLRGTEEDYSVEGAKKNERKEAKFAEKKVRNRNKVSYT